MAALVVFVVVGTAAPDVLKAAKLPWPPWLVAAALGTITGLVGLAKPAVDAYTQAWAQKPARQAELAQRRADLLESVTGGGRSLPRVREITDRALLRIHPAIPLPPEIHQHGLSPELPEYVPRDVDADLRAWLSARRHTGGLLLLVGPAAAGKTRSVYQALLDAVADWRLFMPTSSGEVIEWVESGANPSKTVVWLDDIDRFLGGQGLTIGTVRRLLIDQSQPVLLVGTIWPERLDRLTRPTGYIDDAAHDLGRDVSDLLERWATRFDLTPAFSSAEQDRARQLAERDPRLAEAISMPGDAHIAQSLAAAPELIRRWRNSSNPYGAAVITAAVTARQCGHPEPLPRSILEPLAQNALTPSEKAQAKPEWFDFALAWAREPVRGQAAPLTPHGTQIGVTDGDRVSDVLVQHAATKSDAPAHTVPAVTWHLLITHASPAACTDIGDAASHADGQTDSAQRALRKSAASGHTRGMVLLGILLMKDGPNEESESLLRKAIEAGETDATPLLGIELIASDRNEEGEALLRDAVEAGDTQAAAFLGISLMKNGHNKEAESLLRDAVEAGDTQAMAVLGDLLMKDGRNQEAETLLRKAVEADDTQAMAFLGDLLMKDGRNQEAETLLRKAVEAGNTRALALHSKLLIASGRNEEAETLLRDAVETDDTRTLAILGNLLMADGHNKEAETWLRPAAEAGNTLAMTLLGILLMADGQNQGAETWLRPAGEAGNTLAQTVFGSLLIDDGRNEEAETWLRPAVEAGNTKAMTLLGILLMKDGRNEEAETCLRPAAEAGNTKAMTLLGILLIKDDRHDEAETLLRDAIEAGDTQAMTLLGILLMKDGRNEEAETCLRPAAEAGDTKAMTLLGILLIDAARNDEAETWLRPAVEAGDIQAQTSLEKLLEQRNQLDEARS